MTRRVATLVLAGAIVPAVASRPTPAAEDDYAVVAGTVFRESGFVVADATVTLTPADTGEAKARKKKRKRQSAKCNFQGEFAFRVPPGPATYELRVEAPGLVTDTREITVNALERVDVYVTLKAKAH